MSTDPPTAPRPLPDRRNLRHLKDQAKDLVKTGIAKSITAAQFQIARLYGFASWPKLKAFVESFGRCTVRRLATARTVRSRGPPNAACRGSRRALPDWRWRVG